MAHRRPKGPPELYNRPDESSPPNLSLRTRAYDRMPSSAQRGRGNYNLSTSTRGAACTQPQTSLFQSELTESRSRGRHRDELCTSTPRQRARTESPRRIDPPLFTPYNFLNPGLSYTPSPPTDEREERRARARFARMMESNLTGQPMVIIPRRRRSLSECSPRSEVGRRMHAQRLPTAETVRIEGEHLETLAARFGAMGVGFMQEEEADDELSWEHFMNIRSLSWTDYWDSKEPMPLSARRKKSAKAQFSLSKDRGMIYQPRFDDDVQRLDSYQELDYFFDDDALDELDFEQDSLLQERNEEMRRRLREDER